MHFAHKSGAYASLETTGKQLNITCHVEQETHSPHAIQQTLLMDTDVSSHIVALDGVHNGLFIYFQDGTRGFIPMPSYTLS